MRNKVAKQLRKLTNGSENKGYTLTKEGYVLMVDGSRAKKGTLVLKESGRSLYQQIKKNYNRIKKEN